MIYVEVPLDNRTYEQLSREAKNYNMTVEEFIQQHLEDQYG